MMAASKTEDYQLFGEVLDQGLKELGYSREDLSVELFASDKQHVLDLYCSKGKSCCYKFYWPSFGMAYGNPRFSELGKVLTKVALERSHMVLCSPDWGGHGGNEYSKLSWTGRLSALSGYLMRPSTCLFDARGPSGNPDGEVCSAWWTGVLPLFPGRTWTQLWSRLYNERAMDSLWMT